MTTNAVDHVVVPLDPPHATVAGRMADDLVALWGAAGAEPSTAPHITLVSYSGLPTAAAAEALEPVAAAVAPFTVRAHGYGLFTGATPRDLSLHVMVVRTEALADLQSQARDALEKAGARPDGVTEPPVWTPHITLLDQDLTPRRLAQAVEALAARPHCSWSVPVESLLVGRSTAGATPARLPLSGH